VYSEFFPDSPRVKLFCLPASAADSGAQRDVTIGALLREYLVVAKRNLALSSYNCYQQIADDHLFPMWDTKLVAELTTRELRNWIMTLDGKRKTVQLILTPASASRNVTCSSSPSAPECGRRNTLRRSGRT
jgi:integrase